MVQSRRGALRGLQTSWSSAPVLQGIPGYTGPQASSVGRRQGGLWQGNPRSWRPGSWDVVIGQSPFDEQKEKEMTKCQVEIELDQQEWGR